ncbi:uncharacterized protein [Cherax quadricarinatus]|nr:uncharacterized protein LOC128695582 isoform X2 [Cherax quadricarinatus]XP_053642256.1 uncharacterized protein LOC128695582 isoform X2 [Cherax quadricarinatus]
MRCQHRTYSRSPTADKKASSKNTCCPAKMFLVVKRTHMASGKLSQSTDEYLQEFPTRVYLDFRHNHQLLSPEILRKRDVSEETVQKLTELYKKGHTPLSALEVIKHDLQADYGDQYVFVAADRSKCPDKQFCYRLYYKLFCPKYPKSFGKKMLLELQGHLKPFCEKYDSHCASIEKTEEDNIIIAICSPKHRVIQNENSEDNGQKGLLSVSQGKQSLNVEHSSSNLHMESSPPHLHFNQCHSQSDLLAEGLKTVFDDLLSKLECSPDIYLKPLEAFLKNCQNIKKDNDLVSALQTFGQYSSVTMAISSTLKRQHSADPYKLDPTTIICAKKTKGTRRRLITARPISRQTMSHHENNNSEREVSVHKLSAQEVSVYDEPAHEVSAHEVPAHEVSVHGVSVHEVSAHEISAHEISAHEISAHEVAVHEVSAPEVSVHEVSAHEVSAHEVAAHEVSSNEISAQLSAPEISSHQISAHHIPAHHIQAHQVSAHYISAHHVSSHHVPVRTIPQHNMHLHPTHITFCTPPQRRS